jgi:hypothetical protein
MKRRWNISLWLGFLLVVASILSYIPLFVRFPITRDVPWANYLLFLAAVILLLVGLKRAYGDPANYRGKISGPILSVLSLGLIGFFCYVILVESKAAPAPNAIQAGQPAPQFTLASADGKQVSLADLVKDKRGALLIFYRGYW